MTDPYFQELIMTKINYCIDCGAKISRYSTRCPKCASIERNKNPEYIEKQRLSQTGKKRQFEARKKMSISQKKRFENKINHPNFGKVGNLGETNGRYIDGRTPIIRSLRHCQLYQDWIKNVFEKDNYTCQDCGQIGGKLEAHHIEEFSIIFNEFISTYNQFSIFEYKETLIRLAYTFKPFWDINNGKTLCKFCHRNNYTTRPNLKIK